MHEDEECLDDIDGAMNNAGDEDDPSGFCEAGSIEITKRNGRRLLESADVCEEDELGFGLLNGKDLYTSKEIEVIRGPIREFLQNMLTNMMTSFNEKIEPLIAAVIEMRKHLTDVKRNVSMIQTDQNKAGEVGFGVSRGDRNS